LNSIHEKETGNISIYPNPTNGEIRISSDNSNIQNIILRDVTGKTLVELSKSYLAKEIIAIDMKNFARGIYFLEVKTENGKMVKRVVRD
jgi:hypothetical protein